MATPCWRSRSTEPTLSLDHGYPARVIIPALPGVHNTKWVSRIELNGTLT